MKRDELDGVRRSYDAVAAEYAAHLSDELRDKPFDRERLDDFAARVRCLGLVCDLGCGPGQAARYLRDAGVEVFGLDFSPAMVAEAARLNPDIAFRVGDMLALDVEDGALAGVVAFYAMVHLAQADVEIALREMRRVLRAGGVLLIAFHVGEEMVHRDEMWGKAVNLDFRFLRTERLVRQVIDAGFEIGEVQEREPYPGVEYPSRRGYLLAFVP